MVQGPRGGLLEWRISDIKEVVTLSPDGFSIIAVKSEKNILLRSLTATKLKCNLIQLMLLSVICWPHVLCKSKSKRVKDRVSPKRKRQRS